MRDACRQLRFGCATHAADFRTVPLRDIQHRVVAHLRIVYLCERRLSTSKLASSAGPVSTLAVVNTMAQISRFLCTRAYQAAALRESQPPSHGQDLTCCSARVDRVSFSRSAPPPQSQYLSSLATFKRMLLVMQGKLCMYRSLMPLLALLRLLLLMTEALVILRILVGVSISTRSGLPIDQPGQTSDHTLVNSQLLLKVKHWEKREKRNNGTQDM